MPADPHALPPIDRLPAVPIPRDAGPRREGTGDSAVLHRFVTRSRRWGAEPVPLTARLGVALWILIPLDVAVGGWLLAVQSGAVPCTGPVCAVATLGNHPMFVLACAGTGLIALAAGAVMSAGLTGAGTAGLAAITVGAVASLMALLGILSLILIGLAGIAFVVTLVIAYSTAPGG